MRTLVSVICQTALTKSCRQFPVRELIRVFFEQACNIGLKSNKNSTRGSRRILGKNSNIRKANMRLGFNICEEDIHVFRTQACWVQRNSNWINGSIQLLHAFNTKSGRWAWLMLSPFASAPKLEAWVHSGIGAPLPMTAVQNLSLQQLHLSRRIWLQAPHPLALRLIQCVSDGAFESKVGLGKRHISTLVSAMLSMVLCSL